MKKLITAKHGWLKWCLILLSSLLAITNLTTLSLRGDSLLWSIHLWLPFIVFSVVSIFFPIKDILFTACLFIGVTLTIDQSTIADLQGALFFILALNLYSDKISVIVVSFSIFAGILGRSFLLGMTISQTIGLTIGFIICILIFFAPRVTKDV